MIRFSHNAQRLWRSLKYEDVYLKAYDSVADARAGIAAWMTFYNDRRIHQALGYRGHPVDHDPHLLHRVVVDRALVGLGEQVADLALGRLNNKM